MKSFIVFAVIISAALAAPLTPEAEVTKTVVVEPPRPRAQQTYIPDGEAVILRYESENAGAGGYSWGYDTSNGISHAEEGTLENVGTDDEALVVIGQYSYPGPDGVIYTVTYRAGKGGFQPQGEHIPVA